MSISSAVALVLWQQASFLFYNRFRIFKEFIVDYWTKDGALGNWTGHKFA